LKKVSKFEAVPYRLYRVADDGEFEVEPVRDLKHTRRSFGYHHADDDSASDRRERSPEVQGNRYWQRDLFKKGKYFGELDNEGNTPSEGEIEDEP
jgi:hypothetical protein